MNLYDWVSAGGIDSSSDIPFTSAAQTSLSKPLSLEGVSEIQKIDILITQQWLQAMMWKLSITSASQPGSRNDSVLPFHLPVVVGKAVLSVIADTSQGAVDAHGIGMVSLLHSPIKILTTSGTKTLRPRRVRRRSLPLPLHKIHHQPHRIHRRSPRTALGNSLDLVPHSRVPILPLT